jgi:hypothetical protein
MEGGEIRSIVSVRKGGSKYDRLACVNSLEISSVLRLVSSDGAFSESWNVNAILVESNQIDIKLKPRTFNGAYSYELLEQWPHFETVIIVRFLIDNFEGFGAEGFVAEWTSQEENIVSKDPEIHENTGTRVVVAEWICSSVENIDKV